ncbi:MAG: ZIP family metal transporter [Candidatus Binatus sp.]|uniref:ZIP family metal transporter n=1 Tax=Candidatus Binatus sp. TaxID=2811406 RepID=UPI0027249AC2|nr:ZIP family metal transporter [Candidatus Binatus sp.]MDO8431974.1 ZIP family metal transporter [Candidatus Binatus sp.]
MSPGFLLYLAAIAIGSLAGGLLPLFGNWSRRSLLVPVAFSGGILLGAAFFDMIPESVELLHGALGWPLLAGFLTIFIMERFVLVHPYPEHAAEHGRAHHIHLGLTAYVGLSFHSLLDGLAISSTYNRPELGGVVLLAVIFHKIPDAFALTSLLLLDRWSPQPIIGWMTVFALSTPLGAMLTYFALANASSKVAGAAIAISAGTFLAVATSDILPQIRHENKQRMWPLVALFVGLIVSWLGRMLAG